MPSKTHIKKTTSPTTKALLAAASRRETTVRLCLSGELQAEHEALEAELLSLTDSGGWTASSLADSNPIAPVAERLNALQAEMLEHTVTMRFRALKRRDWDVLLAAHPPKDGQEGAFDYEAFGPALIRACLIDPEITDDEFEHLTEEVLNGAQFDLLFGAAWSANTEATSVPFSERASAVTRWRDESSRLLANTESPEASS